MLHKGRGADTDTSHTLLGLISPGNMICLENKIKLTCRNGSVFTCCTLYEECFGVDQSESDIMSSEWGQACYYVTSSCYHE